MDILMNLSKDTFFIIELVGTILLVILSIIHSIKNQKPVFILLVVVLIIVSFTLAIDSSRTTKEEHKAIQSSIQNELNLDEFDIVQDNEDRNVYHVYAKEGTYDVRFKKGTSEILRVDTVANESYNRHK
ncbi:MULTISPECIES: hypothetical protein [Bacillus]|nr:MULTISPECIES: hypothetical protein [Bacillus]MEC0046427.1 hypothetical protein [Bacillus cereus]AFV21792.1 hypothetical protein BTB_502p04870 [Bacillus thuringiensis Bt407]ERI01031.1 hypothetical protein BTCBT_002586 [Bacillus thuringiensis T01-328]MBN6707793.1 hypothetical protein [Bacillus thuringiensis]MDN7078380.1 hypothetical protein [Bacillus thuringiensis]